MRFYREVRSKTYINNVILFNTPYYGVRSKLTEILYQFKKLF